MMWIFFTVLGSVFAQSASLYEASQGRLGLGVEGRTVPEECKQSLEMSTEDWMKCSQSAHEQFVLHPNEYHFAMWSVVAALRSEQLDTAFDQFEPLLTFLQGDWQDEYWSIVLLEAWLLFEVGLQKEAHTLLKEIPSDSLDASGKSIVLFTEVYCMKSRWAQERFWSRTATSGLLTSWSWWHRANVERYPEDQATLLQNMMHSNYVGQRHYLDFVRFHLQEQKWSTALNSALQGLAQYPNSQHLYKLAVIVARHDEGEAELSQLLKRFPEHTKALLVQSFICAMNQQFQTAWSILETARSYGESSQFFWDLREEVSHQLSKEVQWQFLKEGFSTFPDDSSWLQKLEENARTERQFEELKLLKQSR